MRKRINVNILEVRNHSLFLAGSIYNFREGRESIYIVDEAGQRLALQPFRALALDRSATKKHRARIGYAYQLSLPLRAGACYRFIYEGRDGSNQLSPHYRRFSRLTDLEHSFFVHRDLLIRAVDGGIEIHEDQASLRTSCSELFRMTMEGSAPPEALALRQKALRMREQNKPIWLISDRTDAAGDNGEAFFEYLLRSGAADRYALYFLIDISSPDYERMRAIGPVIPVGSEEHKTAWLAASMIVSSAADNWLLDPFGSDRVWYQDMVDHPFVFLQHGVIKDDLSDWLYFLKKNIRIFVTSSPGEWDSIAHGNYGYDESIVKLTGLARYDKLHNDAKKTIAILPTWRKSAAASRGTDTSDRPYSETFRDSDYCRFYNRLINDPRLLRVMRENGYTGTFYLHPNHRKQWPDFAGNETISVWKDLTPFSRVFAESALMVTDYSSVAIDFAYLGKPVVYAQPDREAFFASHTYTKGYYDYRTDGFGPVCDSFEETVAAIIDLLKQNCRQSELYRQRADHFFPYRDQGNCERIYREILKLEE